MWKVLDLGRRNASFKFSKKVIQAEDTRRCKGLVVAASVMFHQSSIVKAGTHQI